MIMNRLGASVCSLLVGPHVGGYGNFPTGSGGLRIIEALSHFVSLAVARSIAVEMICKVVSAPTFSIRNLPQGPSLLLCTEGEYGEVRLSLAPLDLEPTSLSDS